MILPPLTDGIVGEQGTENEGIVLIEVDDIFGRWKCPTQKADETLLYNL